MEYLKNCVFKFMSSTEFSEKKRLYPVISMILKLTAEETKLIENTLLVDESAGSAEIATGTINSIGALASTSFESLFGKGSFFGSNEST